ncbi:hypothetical protein [Aliamphritea spongicola]|uniref:hypothetical protein n=1 Tax=Aliamphritea spongicola TaxID=707589 RepID=UPI00196B42CC|nr:hypothetical protein [Aliamphritea spongicola]MBN3562664.1 hypothetical protein [Aliamphritea spongicola]
MIYVKRDNRQRIAAVSKIPLEGFSALEDQDCEDVFELASAIEDDELSRMDKALIRVIEDLVMLLVDKNQIRFTDLPVPVQDKILARQKARKSLQPQLDILPEKESEQLIL